MHFYSANIYLIEILQETRLGRCIHEFLISSQPFWYNWNYKLFYLLVFLLLVLSWFHFLNRNYLHCNGYIYRPGATVSNTNYIFSCCLFVILNKYWRNTVPYWWPIWLFGGLAQSDVVIRIGACLFVMMVSVKEYECKHSPFFIKLHFRPINLSIVHAMIDHVMWIIPFSKYQMSPLKSTIFDIQPNEAGRKTWKETRAVRADHRHANI